MVGVRRCLVPPTGDTRIKGRGCVHLHKGKKFFSLFNRVLGIIVYYGLIKTLGIVLMYNVN